MNVKQLNMGNRRHLIFVFGTLKEGFPNFPTNCGTRVSGIFKTVDRLPLYLVGPRNSPWLIHQPGNGHQVFGQVFEVDDLTLKKMDALERISEPDGYRRVLIKVHKLNEEGKILTVYSYLKPREQLDSAQISAGPLPEYTLEHATRYKPRAAS